MSIAETLPLYQSLADELRDAMRDGRLPAGARLPSVREAASSRSLSINTVLAAYRQLEANGLVEARPQSGYFVRSCLPSPPPRQRDDCRRKGARPMVPC